MVREIDVNCNDKILILGNKSKNNVDKYVWLDATKRDDVVYVAQCYSISGGGKNTVKNYYDIYFGGRNKGRFSCVYSICKSAKQKGLICFSRMPKLSKQGKVKISTILKGNFRGSMLSYQNTLKELRSTNCILEIVQEGQTGISWRAMEALVFNKKLLTNNKKMKEFKFYNPEYIQIFDNVDDIDFNWCKQKTAVSYGYQNEYSPVNFIETILHDFGVYK